MIGKRGIQGGSGRRKGEIRIKGGGAIDGKVSLREEIFQGEDLLENMARGSREQGDFQGDPQGEFDTRFGDRATGIYTDA